MTNGKPILITGGAGYIGGHVALALMDRGEEVIVLDNLSINTRETVPVGATFYEGGIEDEALVARIIKDHNIDAVMHFAAFIAVGESVEQPEKYMRNNAEYTDILARTVSGAGVPHFIFSSTAAVYGNVGDEPVAENAPLSPLSPYAESKLLAEKMIKEAGNASGMHAVILRYFNTIGVDPELRAGFRIQEKPSHLVRAAQQAARTGTAFHLFGSDYPTKDGTCVRDYVHVCDIALAHVAALDYLRSGGDTDTFNVGNGEGFTNREVVDAVKRVTGIDFPVIEEDRRPGDPAMVIADTTRIREKLQWKPRFTTLDDMIAHEWAWVNKNTQK